MYDQAVIGRKGLLKYATFDIGQDWESVRSCLQCICPRRPEPRPRALHFFTMERNAGNIWFLDMHSERDGIPATMNGQRPKIS